MRITPTLLGAALLLACENDSDPAGPKRDVAYSVSPGSAQGVMLGAPLFGLTTAPDGSLLAAIASEGVVSIRSNATELMTALPGVNGVDAIGRGSAFAVTGGSTDPTQILPTSRKLFRISRGRAREIADLWAYEQAVNPDQIWNNHPIPVESNPFDVATLTGGQVLVADAAANDVLHVNANGTIDWVAVLTPAVPDGPQPVPTSIAIGPDGGYYVGELTGFPGTPGLARVWRIAPGSRHVVCPSAACKQVAGGFTSIIDLEFGPDGNLYVVELDEAGWFAMELNGFAKTPEGGTVNRCNVRIGSCAVVASGLSLPTAVAVDRHGIVWVAEHLPMLFAAARVSPLP